MCGREGRDLVEVNSLWKQRENGLVQHLQTRGLRLGVKKQGPIKNAGNNVGLGCLKWDKVFSLMTPAPQNNY